MKCKSLWQSPAKAVRSNTSRACGLVSATSSIVRGWLGAGRTPAFIGRLLLKIETEAGIGPIHRSQLADAGQGDVGGLHVPTAKADVCRVDIGDLDLTHDISVGSYDGNVAGDQGRNGDVARGLDSEAVKALKAGQPADETAGVGCGAGLFAQDTGLDDVEGEEARGFGVGDIDGLLVRRQADAVGGQHWMDELDYLRAVRKRVVKPAVVAVAPPSLSKIGEVKPTLAIEDDVVRRRQFVPAALAVENARLAGARIDPLDVAALVILRRPGREKPALSILVAAIVADIKSAVWAARDPIRPAARRPDRRLAAVGRDAGDGTAGDLAQDHRAIGHRHRPLGKPQPRRHYAQIRHRVLLPSGLLRNSVAGFSRRSSQRSRLDFNSRKPLSSLRTSAP